MTHKRIYQSEAQWYFKVRGDDARGPFASYQEANEALSDFVTDCEKRMRIRFNWSRVKFSVRQKLGIPETL